MDHQTVPHQIETERWLWRAFKRGPAEDADRYMYRIHRLIAADVLLHAPDQLSPEGQERALEYASSLDITIDESVLNADGAGEDGTSSDATAGVEAGETRFDGGGE